MKKFSVDGDICRVGDLVSILTPVGPMGAAASAIVISVQERDHQKQQQLFPRITVFNLKSGQEAKIYTHNVEFLSAAQ